MDIIKKSKKTGFKQIKIPPFCYYGAITCSSNAQIGVKVYFKQICMRLYRWHWDERGKAGGHEPPLFPLPCHTLAFLSSGSYEP